MIRHYTQERVTKTGNQWVIGNTVKVGFLSLRVMGCRAEKDGLPDIYTLTNLAANLVKLLAIKREQT